ncbi:aldo/keto reductase [Spiroplasma culicicola]|uniref:Aldo/keto reductase n=1 Tax=Spiroplasma culicicola AES-1 TaxID=1276246 RepID=W6A7V2_9MOLU|nr:aldo/keto reductase [Spiroplasma culicicola]AHI52960.1 aldo/keto reductase [Spiroplasma culicicola AES-1]
MSILNKTLKFNNNLTIPQFGLGTYKLTNEQETYDSVMAALQAGYHHIDAATIYHNHQLLAKAIKDSQVDRNQLFITSKVWNTDHGYQEAKKAIDVILQELELDYIDLLLIHWPTEKRLECWRALEEAVKEGKVKSIGVSNFQVPHLQELLEVCTIKPVINQIELHPALPNKEVVEFCQQHDIVVESWGTMIRGKCFEIEQIQSIAKKHNKTEAQVCLRWAFQKGYVIIPKSSKPKRVVENTLIDDFELDNDDFKLIETITPHRDGPDPDNFDF